MMTSPPKQHSVSLYETFIVPISSPLHSLSNCPLFISLAPLYRQLGVDNFCLTKLSNNIFYTLL